MEQSNAVAEESSRIEANISNRILNTYFEIKNASEETYFTCLLRDCQNDLREVLEAKSPTEKLRFFRKFLRIYGTGCVTTLKLAAGSIARVTIQTSSRANSNSTRYEGSLAASTAVTRASVAGGWAHELKTAGAQGTVDVSATNYPHNASTGEWTKQLLTTFLNQGIEKLADSGAFVALPEPRFDKPLEYPKKEKPEPAKLPPSDIDITKEMQAEIMKEEGFNGTWPEFLKRQEEAMKGIDRNRVVEDGIGARRIALNLQARREDITVADSDWDLGPYIPVDFEVTPWTDIFPSLRSILSYPGTSAINFARIVTFYYTRLQFGQYMSFLLDLGERYQRQSANARYLEHDIAEYFRFCEGYLQEFYGQSDQDITDECYEGWLHRFTEGLEKLVTDERFYNLGIYKAFFRLYGTFSKCPYGFLVHGWREGFPRTVDRERFGNRISDNNGRLVCDGRFGGMGTALRTAIRVLPVIWEMRDLQVRIGFYEFRRDLGFITEFVYISRDPSQRGLALLHLTEEEFRNHDGRYLTARYTPEFVEFFRLANLRLVGFGDVLATTVLRGATPMFREFPFEALKVFPGGA